MDDRYDVRVRGAGIVGCSLALLLARQGLRIALQGALPAGDAAVAADDVRTYALNPASVGLLQTLDIWAGLPADAATPVYDMHVAGDRPGATIDFSAYAQRVRELAWIVDAAALEAVLHAQVRIAPGITIVDSDETVPASLLALAEGKHSATRERLGVVMQRHDYGQVAIAARLVSDRAHQGRALQWFRSPDVLALLPFDRPEAGCSYGLVWSLPADAAKERQALPAQDFDALLAEATGGTAGTLRLASARAAWPLTLARADRWAGPGWVLVGDAAHVVHPLAGQGLNLGLADVIALGRVIAEREPWRGLGEPRLLRRYAAERETPTAAMARVTDGLLQLFGSPAPVWRELRNRGLTLVDHLPPLKRWLTARALDH